MVQLLKFGDWISNFGPHLIYGCISLSMVCVCVSDLGPGERRVGVYSQLEGEAGGLALPETVYTVVTCAKFRCDR